MVNPAKTDCAVIEKLGAVAAGRLIKREVKSAGATSRPYYRSPAASSKAIISNSKRVRTGLRHFAQQYKEALDLTGRPGLSQRLSEVRKLG